MPDQQPLMVGLGANLISQQRLPTMPEMPDLIKYLELKFTALERWQAITP